MALIWPQNPDKEISSFIYAESSKHTRIAFFLTQYYASFKLLYGYSSSRQTHLIVKIYSVQSALRTPHYVWSALFLVLVLALSKPDL